MPLAQDQVAHFRHLVRLRSAADPTKYLTAYAPSNTLNGYLRCLSTEHDGLNQCFWLSTDRPGDEAHDPGTGYIAIALHIDTGPMQNLGCVATAGTNVTFPLSGFTQFTSNYRWIFEAHEDGISITRAGTSLCLTCNTTAGSTIGSVNCQLVTYAGGLNQLWVPEPIDYLAGPMQFAPAADPSLALGASGQSIAVGQRLALIGSDETDRTQTWVGMYAGDPTTLSGTADWGNSLFYPLASDDAHTDQRTYALYPIGSIGDADFHYIVTQGKSHPLVTWGLKARKTKNTDSPLITPHGSLYGQQFSTGYHAGSSIIPSCLTSQDGDTIVGAYPDPQDLLHAVYDATNIAQFWLSVPRNLYAADYPTPYDLRMVIVDHDASDKVYELDELGDVDPTHDITIYPRFTCDWEAFTACLRIRFKSSQSASWGEWEDILAPESGNWAALATDPQWALPYGAEAWIPNCWRTKASDGSDTTSKGFNFSSGLFDGHSGAAACQLSLSIRAIGYDKYYSGQYSGPSIFIYSTIPIPYNGPQSTVEATLVPRTSISTSGLSVGPDGISLSYTLSRAPLDGTSIHISSIRTGLTGLSPVSWLAPEGYDVSITSQSGTITVPWTAGVAINAEMMSGSSMVDIEGTLSNQYATEAFSHMGTMSSPYTRGGAFELQYMTKFFDTIRGALVSGSRAAISRAYTLRMTETGPHVVECDSLEIGTSTSKILFPMFQDDLTDDTQPAIAFGTHTTNGNVCTVLTLTRFKRGMISLSYVLPDSASSNQVKILLVKGNLSHSYTQTLDVQSARRLGGRVYDAAAGTGLAPTLSLTGSIYRDSLSNEPITLLLGSVKLVDSPYALGQIPPDQVLYLRTPYGTGHFVKIVKIDTPRTLPGQLEYSIDLVEVSDPDVI